MVFLNVFYDCRLCQHLSLRYSLKCHHFSLKLLLCWAWKQVPTPPPSIMTEMTGTRGQEALQPDDSDMFLHLLKGTHI